METSLLLYFAFALQLSLGIVFLLSSVPKLLHPLAHVRNVNEYKILPSTVAYVFGLGLIPTESFLAIAFLTGWWIEIALPLAAGMLIVFSIAVGINLRRGRQIACGCFGSVAEQISPRTLARLLLLITIVLLLSVFRSVGSGSLFSVGKVMADISNLRYLIEMAFLAVFIVVVADWILNLPELIFLLRRLQ